MVSDWTGEMEGDASGCDIAHTFINGGREGNMRNYERVAAIRDHGGYR